MSVRADNHRISSEGRTDIMDRTELGARIAQRLGAELARVLLMHRR
ncbi:hypothetical protein WCQ02_24730 [Paraburkholderia tropica]